MLDAVAYCYNPRGYGVIFGTSSSRATSSSPRSCGHYLDLSCACRRMVHLPSLSMHHRINYHLLYRTNNGFKGTPLSPNSVFGGQRIYLLNSRCAKQRRLRVYASVDVASAVDVINDLGLDTLTFLAVTVLVVPAFRMIKASPILGFFFAGVVLNQLGLIRNLTDVKVLSEWGILFLLFEMGLELSLARLKALAKFAFGLGLTQVLLSTLAFTAFELPPNGAIGTRILEFLFHSRPDLVNIRSIDEAVVIGAALSLSSSAFVLQLLAEKGELPTRFGSATLGILLLQDIAVVPLLVILPVLESQNLVEESIWPMLAKESLKALGGLGLLSLGGKYLLRRVFEVVADTRSSEAFVAMCLLTVAGTSLLTQKLGFSDTLGAFLAGALLAETNFRTQIEADIRPFRGLLLGLFFVTTGTSIDMQLLIREWPNVLSLLAGLIVIKTLIITAIGPRVGLTLQESIRIGLLLSQGGEFGFVVFSLANRLGVLPLELNKLLIIVVVLSMALTPLLNDVGRKVADFIGEKFEDDGKIDGSVNFDASEPVVIVGFGQKAQILANFLSTPLASGIDADAGWPYVAFDLDPSVVKTSRKLGFPVLYGDGSRPAVLQSAGINSPKAVMVMYTGKTRTLEAVQRIRLAFPAIPIYARAQDMMHLLDLKKAGATDAILENAETSFQLGSKLLKGFGVMSDDVSFLSQLVRDSMVLQAQETLTRNDEQESKVMKPLQVKVTDLVGVRTPSNNGQPQMVKQTSEESTLKSPAGTAQSHDDELRLDDEEAKGVLYCEIDTGTNVQSHALSITGQPQMVKQTSEDSTLKSPAGIAQSHDDEPHLDDEEAKGVLYCEIDTGNNVQSHTDRVDVNDPVGVANEEP
ncbi:K(+) efflux antiporter 3, chloroplastic [Sesamum alatum]|uniref:K(+) efflux antiporter 3, chloroplastic n=1 Tax=Sesamum alatum TaxID=300844 RepID=A0AAE1YWF8_9LAMI|nr:K(+) efflux antiporter 3, chloroplastic [Sesamum alatum]